MTSPKTCSSNTPTATRRSAGAASIAPSSSQLLQLHVLGKELEHGNRYTARAHSSNIMSHILQTLQAGASGQAVSRNARSAADALRLPLGARHAARRVLRVTWSLVAGRRRSSRRHAARQRADLRALRAPRAEPRPTCEPTSSAQSLDAMRSGKARSRSASVYVPGCPGYNCPFSTFSKIVQGAIDPAFVTNW